MTKKQKSVMTVSCVILSITVINAMLTFLGLLNNRIELSVIFMSCFLAGFLTCQAVYYKDIIREDKDT